MNKGREMYDICSSLPISSKLVSERDVIPIDITDYDIKSVITEGDNMLVTCDVYYKAISSGARYLYFNWYKMNRIQSVVDINGDSLMVIEHSEPFKVLVNQNSEAGFGVVLNEPLQKDQSGLIRIEYECNCIRNYYGLRYTIGNDCWYPMNHMNDPATFHLDYTFPNTRRVVSSGERNVMSFTQGNDVNLQYMLNYPSNNVSFNIGYYYPVERCFENLPPVVIFTHSPISIPRVGADMVNSLAYFTDMFGKCPFDTIKVADTPSSSNNTAPGLENVNWKVFHNSTYDGPIRMANQWWHHKMRSESYRDTWIAEGLAHYCALMYFEKSNDRDIDFDKLMRDWQKVIFYGVGQGSKGYKAGPVVLGKRLNSSKSNDYYAVSGYKGAYIFHMLRYMLHDFNSGSDDIFLGILNDLLIEYGDTPITTERLQRLVENYLGDMSWFFDQCVYGIEIPTYKFSYDVKKNENGKHLVECKVSQRDVSEEFSMLVPITVLYADDRCTYHKLLINKKDNKIELPPLPLKPEKVIFNTNHAVLCRVR